MSETRGHLPLSQAEAAEAVMLDESFQAALQRYAHGNGSSAGVAKAAVRVLSSRGLQSADDQTHE